MSTRSRHTKHFVLSVVTLILLVLNLYAAKAFIIFGSPILFSLALLIELILLAVFVYSLLRLLASPKSIIKSLALSIWGGLASNEYIKKLAESKSPSLNWLRRRLKRNSPSGVPLTLTVCVAAFFLFNFLTLLFSVSSKGSVTQIDTRVLNLVPDIRTPTQTSFFRVVTSFANVQTLILIVVMMAALLWSKHQRLLAGITVAIVLGEEGITHIIKQLVHRMRPARALGLIKENSLSFPSSHEVRATLVLGLIAYFVYRSYSSTWIKLSTIGLYVLAVFLVAVSRIYLGVHYPTDVWGSVLLGGSMLTLVIGFLEIARRYEITGGKKLELSMKMMAAIPVLMLVFALIASSSIVHIQPVAAARVTKTLPILDHASIQKMPHYSETLTGSRMEPINFIYVGSRNQIVNTFLSHGWYKADRSTLANTLKALAVGFQGRQYLTAPVTPSYLNFEPEDIAFEQSTKSHSLRQRHHTRIWLTDYVLPDGRPIWVATASFDEGIEFAGPAKLPTHHIDPNIDAERAYITSSLGLPVDLIDVVQPQLGKNASGDSFFTDGKAEIVILK